MARLPYNSLSKEGVQRGEGLPGEHLLYWLLSFSVDPPDDRPLTSLDGPVPGSTTELRGAMCWAGLWRKLCSKFCLCLLLCIVMLNAGPQGLVALPERILAGNVTLLLNLKLWLNKDANSANIWAEET